MVKKIIFLSLCIILNLVLFSCKSDKEKEKISKPVLEKKINENNDDLVSTEILQRKEANSVAYVKTIMLVFNRKSPRFIEKLDPDKRKDVKIRSAVETENLVKKILKQVENGVDFENLMEKYSDNPKSWKDDFIKRVTLQDSASVMRRLVLRLKPGEVGVVKNSKEYLIIKRIKNPPKVKSPDSVEILKRAPAKKKVSFKVINIPWRYLKTNYGENFPDKIKRSQQQAADLAKKILKKLQKDHNFDSLHNQHNVPLPSNKKHKHGFSPLDKKDGHHDHEHDHKNKKNMQNMSSFVKIHRLAVRLKVGESGIITSKYGYHVVKRFK
ncbi:MAG: peptidylprolyl isomerase [Myxococcota bacterium]